MPKGPKLSYPERKKERMYAKTDIWQGKLAGVMVVLILCVQPLYLNWEKYGRLTWHKFLLFAIYMVCILVGVIIIWAYRMASSPGCFPAESSQLPTGRFLDLRL